MSNFTTKGVNEAGGKFISYGIKDVKVTGIEAKEAAEGSTPSLFINFQELNGEKTVSARFSFSDKAAPYSLRKIKHLSTKVVDEALVDAIDEKTVTGYATALSKLIVGKSMRVKFSAEEIDGTRNGKRNWFKSVVNFPPFAEALSVSPTQLVFDPTRDIKRLAPVTANPTGTTAAEPLPF